MNAPRPSLKLSRHAPARPGRARSRAGAGALLVLLLAGCGGLDQVHREILLNRITTAGEVVAAADPENAAGWRFEFAAIRSDVSANLR